jgi:hypothetical protein
VVTAESTDDDGTALASSETGGDPPGTVTSPKH